MEVRKFFIGVCIFLFPIIALAFLSNPAAAGKCANAFNSTNISDGLNLNNNNNRFVINFNLTGNNTLVAIQSDVTAANFKAFEFDNISWVQKATLINGLPSYQSGDNARIIFAGNLTGNTSREVAAIQAPTQDVNILFWNGTGWQNDSKGYGSLALGGFFDSSAGLTMLNGFPDDNRSALIGLRTANTNIAWQYVYGVWSRNDSLAEGINDTYSKVGVGSAYNLTDEKNWSLYIVYNNKDPRVVRWNGTSWFNVSLVNKSDQINNPSVNLIDTYFSAGKIFTIGSQGTGALYNFTNITPALDNIVIGTPTFNSSVVSYNDNVLITVGVNSSCGVSKTYLASNNGSGYSNQSPTLTSPLSQLVLSTSTFAGTGLCNQSFSFIVTVESGTKNQSQSATNYFISYPSLYNQSLSNIKLQNINCTSATNLTVNWNQSIEQFMTFTLNATKLNPATNNTCFYKTNNGKKIIGKNLTQFCELTIQNSNTSFSATIDVDTSFSIGAGGNLGIAITIGTVAVVVISIIFARRRRASE